MSTARQLCSSVLLVASVVFGDAAAQEWVRRSVYGALGPDRVAMAYDAGRGEVVAFGGGYAGIVDDATWVWDGIAWRQQLPATRPPARWAAMMVYDPQTETVVLFGGNDPMGAGDLDDTWEWDGSDWREVPAVQRPPARHEHALAYCDAARAIVLYGGTGSGGSHGDTWLLPSSDRSRWLQHTGAAPPTLRDRALASWHDEVILVGRESLALPLTTWVWDGGATSDWVQLAPSDSPGIVGGCRLVADTVRDRAVLTCHGDPRAVLQTWEWDGASWMRVWPASSPPASDYAGMAFDAGRRRTVRFGGTYLVPSEETWEYYDPLDLYAPFGVGCAGSAGVPTLAAAPGSLPWLDELFRVELTSLPRGSAVSVALAFSRDKLGATDLPLDLGFLGMDGCELYQSMELVYPVANLEGRAAFGILICDCADLVGLRFYNQGFVLDAAANTLGITVTNAATGTVTRK